MKSMRISVISGKKKYMVPFADSHITINKILKSVFILETLFFDLNSIIEAPNL
ncbi:hypothetical protein CLU83_2907 [Flavobacterium sp. 1]|nr:hypothetical protein CLU83_2907 [Flavobacterium sp. 1]